MNVSDDVKAAARKISRELWNEPYTEGRGPLHFATGPYHSTELRRLARRWRRLADAAEVVADAMSDGTEQQGAGS
jgi:hypothetical protein